jgi:hypothetical protein
MHSISPDGKKTSSITKYEMLQILVKDARELNGEVCAV